MAMDKLQAFSYYFCLETCLLQCKLFYVIYLFTNSNNLFCRMILTTCGRYAIQALTSSFYASVLSGLLPCTMSVKNGYLK